MGAELYQYVVGWAAAMGAFAAGTMLGWSSPAEVPIMNGDAYDFTVSTDDFSWIGSLVTFGAALICVPIGIIMNAIGRKPAMLLLVLPFMIGWVLIILASSPIMLMAGRFMLGMAGGGFCITAPMYTTEIATVEARGTLGSFFQLLLVCGVLLAYILGAAMPLKTMNYICAALPIVFAVSFMWMPESPLFRVQKNDMEGALKSVKALRSKDYDCEAEVARLKAANDKTKEIETTFTAAMCRKTTLKATALSILLMVFQQMGGINAVIFYSTTIFDDANAGLSGATATITIGVVMVVATVVSVLVVDRLGRRILLLTSGLFQALTTTGLAVFFFIKDGGNDVSSLNWLPISSVMIFILMFSVGYGPVPWLMMAELFSEDVKPYAGPLAGMSNWLMAFLVTKTFPLMKSAWGSAIPFFFYTAWSVLGLIVVALMLPETKGRTIQEIQDMLEGKKKSDD